MRERIVATSLAVAIAFGTAACGGKAPIGHAVIESTEASENAAAEGTSKEADKGDEFTPGVVKGNTYENEYFNVKISIPEDMAFADSDTLTQINGNVSEYTDNEAAKKAIEASKATVVAYANKSDGTSFNVSISSAGKLTTAVFAEESIIEGSKDMTVEELEKMGITGAEAEVEKTTFLGEEHSSLVINGKSPNGDFHVKMLVLLRDGYIATFTVGGPSVDNFAMFDNATKLH